MTRYGNTADVCLNLGVWVQAILIHADQRGSSGHHAKFQVVICSSEFARERSSMKLVFARVPQQQEVQGRRMRCGKLQSTEYVAAV